MLLWSQTDTQISPLKTYAVRRPESAALVCTKSDETSEVDLAKVEEVKPEGNTCTGEQGSTVVTTTVVHFDVEADDLEDDYTDLNFNTSPQVKPEMAVNHNLPQEQEDSHFSFICPDDNIPLV